MKLTITITKSKESIIDTCLGKKGLVGTVIRLNKNTGIIHLRKYFPSHLTNDEIIDELSPVTDAFLQHKVKFILSEF